MRWSVYFVSGGRARAASGLGYVNAKNQPEAVRRACKRWPEIANEKSPSFGFAVRQYAYDAMSLGKLRKK